MNRYKTDRLIKSFCRSRMLNSPLYEWDEGLFLREVISGSREAFYENERNSTLSHLEFLRIQSGYIKKRLWVAQGLILAVLWYVLNYIDIGWNVQKGMAITASLFGILAVPELWKNKNANAMEVEGSSYYNLRQIYAARILVFAMVDLAMVSVFGVAVCFNERIRAADFIINFLIPFNVNCGICFETLFSKKNISDTEAAIICCILSAIWVEFVINERIYSLISEPLWFIIFIISILYMVCCIVRGQKNFDKLWEGDF